MEQNIATEEVLKKLGWTKLEFDSAPAEDRRHVELTVEFVLESPACAIVELGRESARRVWGARVD